MGVYKSLEALLQEVPLDGEARTLTLERKVFGQEDAQHLAELPYRVLKQTLGLKPRKLGGTLYHSVYCYIVQRYVTRPQNLTLYFPPACATAFVHRGKGAWKAVTKSALLLDVLNLAAVSLASDFSKQFSLG